MIDRLPKARQSGIVVQEMPGEVLIYDTKTNKAHCLNETAAAVWRRCDGNTKVEDLALELGSGHSGLQVPAELIFLAVDQLSDKGLLETKLEGSVRSESRRDALKKIGMTAVVALPIIASLAAPKSALAATSCACVSDAECMSMSGCDTMCDNMGMSPTFLCVA